ncbi:serpin family protein [Actinacidiphila acidipaludis]|uniref:serpin family protein n=1 Tax=Actinacidiphila acidipaludis TaxID=2873382 RepID=UPI0027E20DC8|nr:serpin family protein [Streptomyces acidipaludis]
MRAVNALTVRWARFALHPRTGGVLSAACVWPLLAFLGGAADGPARPELAAALEVDPDTALSRGRALTELLANQAGLSAALGVWTQDRVVLREEWLRRLPPAVVGRLTGDAVKDRAELDAWADRATAGRVPRMPVGLDEATVMVLAAALTVETRWLRPFVTARLRPRGGPWFGRDLAGLGRPGTDLDEVRVAATPHGRLTVFEVAGDNGIDVRLLMGEDGASPRVVLAAGERDLAGAYASTGGGSLPEGEAGPGVTIVRGPAWEDSLWVTTPAFTVESDHDLLRRPEVFGLKAATDSTRGHFPGISRTRLAMSRGRQTVTASFSAEGFEAAAVTAFEMRLGAGLPRSEARQVDVAFDRPFAFLAVHRASRLILAAGWVAEPRAAPPGRPGGW